MQSKTFPQHRRWPNLVDAVRNHRDSCPSSWGSCPEQFASSGCSLVDDGKAEAINQPIERLYGLPGGLRLLGALDEMPSSQGIVLAPVFDKFFRFDGFNILFEVAMIWQGVVNCIGAPICDTRFLFSLSFSASTAKSCTML